MNDCLVPILCAIECLKDYGIDKPTIEAKIAAWVREQGYGCNWHDLPPIDLERLGGVLQKSFESKFRGQPICLT